MLPKTYNNRGGKFPEHKGKPKISYSQVISWESYTDDYIRGYILGIKEPPGEYARFGSACGEYLEHLGQGLEYTNDMLSEQDIEILSSVDLSGERVTFEEEIVIDYGDFVLQGFIDKAKYDGDSVVVTDFKTGNIEKKRDYYTSDDYLQTTAYCQYLESIGYEIKASEVVIFDRKGNAFRGERLSLTGDVETLETPFTEERKKLLEQRVRNAAKGVSDLYKNYTKYASILL